MAEQHGGKRTPRNPAPVSGPGRMSRRTDGGPQQTTVPMTGMGYGENADFNEMQSGAPLAAAPTVSTTRTRNMSPTGQRAAATPLFAPTQRPDEPITAGMPFGPGPGPTPYPTPVPTSARPKLSDTLTKIASTTGDPSVTRLLDVARRLGW